MASPIYRSQLDQTLRLDGPPDISEIHRSSVLPMFGVRETPPTKEPIPELLFFYQTSSASSKDSHVFDLKWLKDIESQGLWFLETFRQQATKLGIARFVLDKKLGGVSLPKIASTSAYEQLFIRQDEEEGFRVADLGITPLTLEQLGERVQRASTKVSDKEIDIQAAKIRLRSLGTIDPNVAAVP